MKSIKEQFGNIDIYLFAQLLNGPYSTCKRILDLGCGSGRNLSWFLQQSLEVYGIDQDPVAVQTVRTLAARLAPNLPQENFKVGKINTEMSFKKGYFDLIICNAVFHFAENKTHFEEMLWVVQNVI